MKKKYFTPETNSLEVMAHDMLCASGGAGAPGRTGQIGSMDKTEIAW